MKKSLVGLCVLSSLVFGANHAHHAMEAKDGMYNPKSEKEFIVIPMELLGKDGNKSIGEIVVVNTKYGVAFFPNLKGITEGQHGFHVHANGDCGSTEKGLGMKAGGHWDPAETKAHSFPWDDKGHKGDLPALYANKDGVASYPVLAPKIKNISELKGKSVMVHIGGDNHHDKPAALGGGGARMACGVIK